MYYLWYQPSLQTSVKRIFELLVAEQVALGDDAAPLLDVFDDVVPDGAVVQDVGAVFGDLVQSVGVDRPVEEITFAQHLTGGFIHESSDQQNYNITIDIDTMNDTTARMYSTML